MGVPDEEQELKLEALAPIFLEDYELLSEGKPREVKVRLVPVPGEDAGEENKVDVWMAGIQAAQKLSGSGARNGDLCSR